MLIRSQDKTVLIDKNKIYRILKNGSNNYIITLSFAFALKTNPEILAKYSTIEKAIKVMTMLEKHINNSNTAFNETSHSPTYTGEIATQCNIVFQFPKDEDVKI